MNLTAYSEENNALFVRQCRDRDDAREQVVFNPWSFRVHYVIYKGKRYEMKEVYAW